MQSAESPLILILCQFIVEIFWQKYVETLFTKKEHFFPTRASPPTLCLSLSPCLPLSAIRIKTFFVIDLLRIWVFTNNDFYNLGNGWFFM